MCSCHTATGCANTAKTSTASSAVGLPWLSTTLSRKKRHTSFCSACWQSQVTCTTTCARKFLSYGAICNRPRRFLHYRNAGAIILRISHGYHIQEERDPFVDLADTAVDQFSRSTAPGAFMVDIIPACKLRINDCRRSAIHISYLVRYVPEWFPGAGFKRMAREWNATLQDMVDQPYKFVKDQMVYILMDSRRASLTIMTRPLELPRNHSPQTCCRAGRYRRRMSIISSGLLLPCIAVSITRICDSLRPLMVFLFRWCGYCEHCGSSLSSIH